MTVKQEYEKMQTELRSWNKRSNFDDTKYAYHIEHHTKKAKQMFLNLLNSDFEKINFDINLDTLKAIRLKPEEVQILRKAAGIGVNNLKTAERALKSKRRGYWSDRKRKAAEMTIDIFRKISE